MGSKKQKAFADGYYQAVVDTSWECGDCCNRYGPDVDNCPNDMMDRAALIRKNAYAEA